MKVLDMADLLVIFLSIMYLISFGIIVWRGFRDYIQCKIIRIEGIFFNIWLHTLGYSTIFISTSIIYFGIIAFLSGKINVNQLIQISIFPIPLIVFGYIIRKKKIYINNSGITCFDIIKEQSFKWSDFDCIYIKIRFLFFNMICFENSIQRKEYFLLFYFWESKSSKLDWIKCILDYAKSRDIAVVDRRR